MNITLAQLDSLLYSAREEGLEAGLREAEINQQFAQVQTNVTPQEYVETPEAELPLPGDVNPDEAFNVFSEVYDAGYDDGFQSAMDEVRSITESV